MILYLSNFIRKINTARAWSMSESTIHFPLIVNIRASFQLITQTQQQNCSFLHFFTPLYLYPLCILSSSFDLQISHGTHCAIAFLLIAFTD